MQVNRVRVLEKINFQNCRKSVKKPEKNVTALKKVVYSYQASTNLYMCVPRDLGNSLRYRVPHKDTSNCPYCWPRTYIYGLPVAEKHGKTADIGGETLLYSYQDSIIWCVTVS